jgi:hypothetical protein
MSKLTVMLQYLSNEGLRGLKGLSKLVEIISPRVKESINIGEKEVKKGEVFTFTLGDELVKLKVLILPELANNPDSQLACKVKTSQGQEITIHPKISEFETMINTKSLTGFELTVHEDTVSFTANTLTIKIGDKIQILNPGGDDSEKLVVEKFSLDVVNGFQLTLKHPNGNSKKFSNYRFRKWLLEKRILIQH